MGRDGLDNIWYYSDMTLHAPAIPAYDLYGDGDALPFEEFFHCETIKVRSQRYEWEISPHLHPALSQVLFVARGQVDLRLGAETQSLIGPQLVIVPTPIVHGFRFSPDVVGYVVTVSQSFLTGLPRQDVLRLRMDRPAVHAPDSATARRLLLLGRELLRAEPGSAGANGHMLHRALGEAWLRLAIGALSGEAGEERALVRRFRALVETSYRAHRPLSHYAAQLNCTERTLARQVNEALGMTPRQVINRRLLVEARRLLRFTNAGCADVAAELGFDDPSYFSRFYLREAGIRPNREKAGTHEAHRA